MFETQVQKVLIAEAGFECRPFSVHKKLFRKTLYTYQMAATVKKGVFTLFSVIRK